MSGITSTPLRLPALFAILALLGGPLAACGPQNNQSAKVAAPAGRQEFRTACAGDLQKFCSGEQKKRRCLQDNLDKVSDSCKSALAEMSGKRGKGLRAVCADDIQKLCSAEPKKRRCLQNNLD